jgi:hypothetical protein
VFDRKSILGVFNGQPESGQYPTLNVFGTITGSNPKFFRVVENNVL